MIVWKREVQVMEAAFGMLSPFRILGIITILQYPNVSFTLI